MYIVHIMEVLETNNVSVIVWFPGCTELRLVLIAACFSCRDRRKKNKCLNPFQLLGRTDNCFMASGSRCLMTLTNRRDPPFPTHKTVEAIKPRKKSRKSPRGTSLLASAARERTHTKKEIHVGCCKFCGEDTLLDRVIESTWLDYLCWNKLWCPKFSSSGLLTLP
jgi:hypothetical protein